MTAATDATPRTQTSKPRSPSLERASPTFAVEPRSQPARAPSLDAAPRRLRPAVTRARKQESKLRAGPEHGLEPRLQGGTITLRSRIQGAKLVVEVEDDGVGMAEGRAREVGFVSRGAGIGMRNVRERLEVLYGNNARFEVFSRPGRGTRVTLEIPMAPNVLVLADQTSARASTVL